MLVGLLFLHPVPFDGQGQKICSTKKCADLFFFGNKLAEELPVILLRMRKVKEARDRKLHTAQDAAYSRRKKKRRQNFELNT